MSWLSDITSKVDIDPTHGAGFTGAGTPWGAPNQRGLSMFNMMPAESMQQFEANQVPNSPSASTQTVPKNPISDYSASDMLEQKLKSGLAGKQSPQNINFGFNLQNKPSTAPNTGVMPRR